MDDRERETVIEDIIAGTALDDVENLKSLLENAHPAEVAKAIRYMDQEERERIMSLLSPENFGEVLVALRTIDEGAEIEILGELDSGELSEMLNVMEPDDAADVVSELPKDNAAEVLDLMEDEESRDVQELLKYSPDTAGGIMTSEFIALGSNVTAQEAIDYLRENPSGEHILYIYVTDEEDHLLGVVSLEKLVTEAPDTKLGDIVVANVISVTPDVDQEEAATLINQYGLFALPVLDKQNRILGIITIDDAMQALTDEATEDIYKLAGTSDDELISRSAFKVAQIRLPWLFICLMGSLFSGIVIRLFSGTISQAISIASFIPAIMAMGGNTGLQSSTATVRGIATGYINLSKPSNIIFKEIRTVILMSITCGITMAIIAVLWKSEHPALGAVVGISIFLAMSLSATMGVLIPILFKRINIDPAVASGPLITMINDITGLLVYLTMAMILLRYLV